MADLNKSVVGMAEVGGSLIVAAASGHLGLITVESFSPLRVEKFSLGRVDEGLTGLAASPLDERTFLVPTTSGKVHV